MQRHQLTDIDETNSVGTCAVCGPDAPLRFRRHRNQWACRGSAGESAAGKAVRARRHHLTNPNRLGYSMTVTEYDQMLMGQLGTCAICDKADPSGKRLTVDHCHNTGAVRGLLCAPCNRAIGLMKDDPELLLRAVRYLAAQ